MKYKYLLYSSVSEIDKINVYDILKVAREENKKFGITGFLICHLGGFYQLIEGKESNINQLYHNISTDERHSDVNMIIVGEREERFFPDWQMGYVRIEEDIFSQWNNIKDKDLVLNEFISTAQSSLQF
ncbi:BLUF domain-containing protein [Vibrio salinus]|uniref:BLUF domain-containing protein n=1 Tax=Vibrio salinus TaxID=2899784 RepID=UPI001E514553|nr:BLUF domain-containing protein [Vibrio salinus]MCE0495280.1 BLUF domain-containing protein [Vibrio salinus]